MPQFGTFLGRCGRLTLEVKCAGMCVTAAAVQGWCGKSISAQALRPNDCGSAVGARLDDGGGSI